MGTLQLPIPTWAHPDFQPGRYRLDNVDIRWSNDLARGLDVFIVPTQYGSFDLVTRKYLSFAGGGSIAPVDHMMARIYTGPSNATDYLAVQGRPSTLSMTVGAMVRTFTAGNDDGIMDYGQNVRIKLATSSNGSAFRAFAKSPNNTGLSYSGGPLPHDGRIHRVISSMTGGGKLKMDVDNIGIQSTNKSGSTPEVPVDIYFGARSGGGGVINGAIFCSYAYGRQLSDIEMLAVNRDPMYELLQPRVPIFYSLPSASSTPVLALIGLPA